MQSEVYSRRNKSWTRQYQMRRTVKRSKNTSNSLGNFVVDLRKLISRRSISKGERRAYLMKKYNSLNSIVNFYPLLMDIFC